MFDRACKFRGVVLVASYYVLTACAVAHKSQSDSPWFQFPQSGWVADSKAVETMKAEINEKFNQARRTGRLRGIPAKYWFQYGMSNGDDKDELVFFGYLFPVAGDPYDGVVQVSENCSISGRYSLDKADIVEFSVGSKCPPKL